MTKDKEQRKYSADDIKVLKGIDPVRKRPGMYIQDLSMGGLNQLVWEAVDNAVDESLAGYCTEIGVVLNPDDSVSITDNGRGIPVEMHPTEKIPTVEVVLTTLHAGGKFDAEAYKVSGGLHGVGISVTNALSEWLIIEVKRDGLLYHQRYERGKKVSELETLGKATENGTKITFKPEYERFTEIDTGKEVRYSYDRLASRLRELAYLNKGIVLKLRDERSAENVKEDVFRYDGGVKAFIDQLHENKNVIHNQVFYFEKTLPYDSDGTKSEVTIEIALQYNDGYDEKLYSFANNINTYEGGTHVSGFRSALTRCLNNYATSSNLLKKNEKIAGEDYREGLTTIINVKVPQPKFQSQAKSKLLNNEISGITETQTAEHLSIFLEENPKIAKGIITKALQASRARIAARKAREAARKEVLGSGSLPGKLTDCSSRDVGTTEIFLVEGDSAGGSAKQGRDRVFQAILPLKGKILNVEKARFDKILQHDEIVTLFQALGMGIPGVDKDEEGLDISKLRYGKVIIMTDADVDGSHIRTLLLTFFCRQMPELLRRGYIYIAQPPLYKVKKGRREQYVQSDKEMQNTLLEIGLDGTVVRQVETDQSYEGQKLRDLVELLVKLEDFARIIARKGISFQQFLEARCQNTGRLPEYLLRHEGHTSYCYDAKELSAFLEKLAERLGKEVFLYTEDDASREKDESYVYSNEVRIQGEIQAVLDKLKNRNIRIEDYHVPRAVAASIKYEIVTEKETIGVDCLAKVIGEIRALGRKDIDIQRYKGLGEMNAEQLWETTMDPAKRTLLQVKFEDEFEADKMFTILMGQKVEPRREFIERHALEVKFLDV
ncbi:MAG: DNA topoisomerase (ATP-hydrolyzing) subunit B [Planctomycetes bacterium]|nr:DNA topoisomerase (ATP-hydrolyzing) subunit B [Planctomycetota bacterium]